MDDTLLSVLANPAHPDRPPLELRRDGQGGELLVCTLTGTGFRVADGIPQLLPEQAISPEETKALLEAARG